MLSKAQVAKPVGQLQIKVRYLKFEHYLMQKFCTSEEKTEENLELRQQSQLDNCREMLDN